MSADHDEVVWFDVRVDNASAVDELHCLQHLFPVESQLRGRHPLVYLEPVEDVREVALPLLQQQVQGVLAVL